VAGEGGPVAPGEQQEALVEAVGDLLDRQRAGERGGQLDGERDPVELLADADDGPGVGLPPR